MASTLTGRRALVTGAAGGIGAAIARRLLRDGARVMIADIDATGGARTARELGEPCVFQAVDVASEGTVVNLSSIFGVTGLPAFPAYSAAKGSIANLTRLLDTEAAAESLRQREAAAARQPIARQCSPDEIAVAVAFLASPDASFVTGVLLPVGGGFLAQGDWRGPGQAA
ncbi:SDR family NAD(P)-dependent oxidoreductase [Nonomuraea sp. ZG12]|uniref:SDR family NAD(P)-dependent oxidoreductase n=1 Tax=Nonomuraea sp. ZG12 TaxID=3452207 RepID=UPI003F8ABB90